MMPLRGDVKLRIANPYETSSRRYTELRKLLAGKAGDLEIPYEEVEETSRRLSHAHQQLGMAGRLGRVDIKEAERQGVKVVEYRVLMRLEGAGEEDTGYILVVVRPLNMLGEYGGKIFGKYGLVGKDPIATINEFFPYPYDDCTLTDKGIDTTEIDQRMITQLLDSLHSEFGVLGVNILATDFYKDVFTRNGFMPYNPELPFTIGYRVLEEV